MRSMIVIFFLLTMLAACSNTWEGVKQDSKSIGKSIGEAMKNVGEELKKTSE